MLVATTDGFVYIYPVEIEGGELTLLRQHKVGVKVRLFTFFLFNHAKELCLVKYEMLILRASSSLAHRQGTTD